MKRLVGDFYQYLITTSEIFNWKKKRRTLLYFHIHQRLSFFFLYFYFSKILFMIELVNAVACMSAASIEEKGNCSKS